MYAAIAAASWPFGRVTEVSARMPSAIAASILVVLFYLFFRRFVGKAAGLVAGCVVPLSVLVLDKATSAEIDMLQVTWVAGGIVCAAFAIDGDTLAHRRRLNGWWIGALLCVAGGLLTKWTAPAFLYCTVLPLLWWRGQLRLLWSASHLTAVAIAVAIVLAWGGVAVAREGWENLYATVKIQATTHLLPTHHHRPYPWLESIIHPFKFWLAALPISIFAIPALSRRFMSLWDERGRFLLQVLHCWTWPNLLFWSIVPAHNTRHSLPLYPGIAGLAAMVWVAWLSGKLPWRVRWVTPAKALIGVIGCWVVVKLAFVHYVTPERMRGREPKEKGELLASLVPADATLYLFRLKDEGIMFYYRRPVRRLATMTDLPSSPEPLYCMLEEVEWKDSPRHTEVVHHTRDEQGAPIVLVRVRDIRKVEQAAKSHADDPR